MKKVPSIVVGIDLGNTSFKAVRLQKKGNQYALARVALLPNPRNPQDQTLPTEQVLAGLIKEIGGLVKTSGAEVHLTVNSLNSTVRSNVELPNMTLDELRTALKLNSATYLRQNFENYTFDPYPLDAEAAAALMSNKKMGKKGGAAAAHGKIKALVAGIDTAEAILYFHAARRAGIKPRSLQLTAVSLINAFEVAQPEVMATQAVGLLDMGYFSSWFTILDKGKPLLVRPVQIGGKNITDYLAQMTSTDFAKAETTKLQGEGNLAEALARICVPLIREVRGNINFFEKDSDQAISKIYLSGAAMRSKVVAEALSTDIGVICEPWNAAGGLAIELPPDQQDLFEKNQATFAAAIGAARSACSDGATAAAPVSVAVVAAPGSPSKSTVQPPAPKP